MQYMADPPFRSSSILCSSVLAMNFEAQKLWKGRSGPGPSIYPDQMFHIFVDWKFVNQSLRESNNVDQSFRESNITKKNNCFSVKAKFKLFFPSNKPAPKCETFGRVVITSKKEEEIKYHRESSRVLKRNPTSPFPNFRALKSANRGILSSSGTSCEGLSSSKIVKGFVGLETRPTFSSFQSL